MSGLQTKTIIGVGVGIGASAAAGLYYWYKTNLNQVPPTKWKRVGKLQELCYYPIKSCGPIILNSADCENLGIVYQNIKDHAFMLVNDTNELVSARGYPKMVTIQPRIDNGKLYVSAANMEDLYIDLNDIVQGHDIQVKLFEHRLTVTECGARYEKWFSKFIIGQDSGIKLVYYPYPDPTKSEIPAPFRNGIFKMNDLGSLQDVSSYMLMNQNSVDDLNEKLTNKVHARQFRGTFLVKTSGPPYDEDNWKWIKIGNDAIFRALAPCYRCIFPNVKINGERDLDMEPQKTMKTYRVWGKSKSPRLGVQLGLRVPGTVKEGDDVYVEDE